MKKYIRAAIQQLSSETYEVQRELVNTYDITSDALDDLANSPFADIKFAVAKHRNVSLDTLLKLCDDPNVQFRRLIAQKLLSSEKNDKVLAKLLQDKDSQVRIQVLYNYTVSDELLSPLVNDEEPEVRRVLAGVLTDPALLSDLVDDESSEVRLSVAENPSANIFTLHKLSLDDDRFIRAMVAANKSTAPEDLAALSKDDFYRVRLNVAKNWYTPKETLQELTQDPNEDVANKAMDRLGGYI